MFVRGGGGGQARAAGRVRSTKTSVVVVWDDVFCCWIVYGKISPVFGLNTSLLATFGDLGGYCVVEGYPWAMTVILKKNEKKRRWIRYPAKSHPVYSHTETESYPTLPLPTPFLPNPIQLNSTQPNEIQHISTHSSSTCKFRILSSMAFFP